MRDTIIIRERFSGRDDAEEARQMLEYADSHTTASTSCESAMIRVSDPYAAREQSAGSGLHRAFGSEV